jgi:integrase
MPNPSAPNKKVSKKKFDSRSLLQNLPTNTQRAYAADWSDFLVWCEKRSVTPFPVDPDLLAGYLQSLANLGLSYSTTRRRLAAISFVHQSHRLPSPSDAWPVRQALRKLARDAKAPATSKKPLGVPELQRMVAACPDTCAGSRDKALLLFGFCTALRRSELVALRLGDLERSDRGLVISIRSSNKSASKRIRKIALPWGKNKKTCPVRALLAWISTAEIESGPLFRAVNKFGRISSFPLSDRVIGDIIKKYCAKIGRRPEGFSGYSLRIGFIQAAMRAGASKSSIQRQTGHSSIESLSRYVGDIAIFDDNPLLRINI